MLRLTLLTVSAALLGACASKAPKPPPVDPDDKPAVTISTGAIRMPQGIDLGRLRLVDEARMTKVYIEMVGVGDPANEKLLFPAHIASQVGVTTRQMNRLLMDTVGAARRFEVYDSSGTVTQEQTDIVIDGQITSTLQDLVALDGGVRKARTSVRMSLQMKERETGRLLFQPPVVITGQVGNTSGSGAVLGPRDTESMPEVQRRLAQDYQKAMLAAFDDAARRIHQTLRPMGKVLSVDGDSVGLLGGSVNGLQGDDTMVVFRARTVRIGDGEEIAGTKAIAVVRCDGVGTRSSQCDITRLADPKDRPKEGDYAVLTDRASRETRVE